MTIFLVVKMTISICVIRKLLGMKSTTKQKNNQTCFSSFLCYSLAPVVCNIACCVHGRRKEFFQWGGQKWWNLFFTPHFKKQPFFANSLKIPVPLPTPAVVCRERYIHFAAGSCCRRVPCVANSWSISTHSRV